MLFDQIASNKRRTWFLLIAFFGLLALIGAAVGYLWLDSAFGGLIFAFIIGGIYAISMIFQSTEVVMAMNDAGSHGSEPSGSPRRPVAPRTTRRRNALLRAAPRHMAPWM